MSGFINDLDYTIYQERQLNEITPERLEKNIQGIQSTNKFKYSGGKWNPLPYEGFALLSMLGNNPGNELLLKKLTNIKDQLAEAVPKESISFLPPESYHQTVANLLSGQRFYQNILQKIKTKTFIAMMGKAFEKESENSEEPNPEPIRMSMIGLSVFTSALGILGIFKDKKDYQRIIDFRKTIYSNSALNELDIKRTRPFIGHITLAYLDGDMPNCVQKDFLEACLQVNKEFLMNSPINFNIHQAELRNYQHLAQFDYQPEFPVYQFSKS